MIVSQRTSENRRGAALVEFALVVTIFFFFFFGILEYCRLVYVRQVVMNASREGARYAVVNLFDSTIVADTQAVVKTKMCGLDSQTTYYNCQVYLSDSTGVNIGSAANATFGQYIAVQVDYDHKPLLPSFLKMNSTIRITARDCMYSESN
jgi:Flp pilus assembly protein TadG